MTYDQDESRGKEIDSSYHPFPCYFILIGVYRVTMIYKYTRNTSSSYYHTPTSVKNQFLLPAPPISSEPERLE